MRRGTFRFRVQKDLLIFGLTIVYYETWKKFQPENFAWAALFFLIPCFYVVIRSSAYRGVIYQSRYFYTNTLEIPTDVAATGNNYFFYRLSLLNLIF